MPRAVREKKLSVNLVQEWISQAVFRAGLTTRQAIKEYVGTRHGDE